MRETLPEGFQRSEFQLEHGALDMILDRRDMRDRVSAMLRLLLKLPPLDAAEGTPPAASAVADAGYVGVSTGPAAAVVTAAASLAEPREPQ
ncbi:MAG: hypothetical protein ACREUG_12115, partial [Steroidobacteraceae bacterium]